MTLIEYYLFANIYIIAFWIGYRIALNKLIHFKSVRIYLNAALVLSALLPLIQFSIAGSMGSSGPIAAVPNIPLTGIVYSYQWSEALPAATGQSINWITIIKAILISGSAATALFYVYIHLRIRTIIRESTHYRRLEDGLRALLSEDVNIPFVYFNRIVIPETIAEDDLPQVLTHESLHHRNTHHFDNLLYSMLHILFWVNPFFLLLRKALKLNHEYQVDKQMLSTGMDPVLYKLSLVKYSVGSKLFALANGLSSTNTKYRIMMINHIHVKKGTWKMFVLLPLITLLFVFFTIACVELGSNEAQSDTRAELTSETSTEALSEGHITVPQEDTVQIEFVKSIAGPEGGEVVWAQNSVIPVLINKDSRIMIAEKVLSLEDAEQRIISVYMRQLEENSDIKVEDFPENTSFETKIYFQRDIAADDNQVQMLLDAISNALFKLRDMHSVKFYGKLFTELDESEKERISRLIPLRIYGANPKNMSGMDTPPLFKGQEKEAFMHYIAQNLEYPESIAEAGITGRVIVKVVIEKDGSIGDVIITQGAHPDLDKEAIRVVKSSPKWTPATKNWKKVPATLEFSMNFALN